MSRTFEVYFSLAEIAQRIPKSDKFWRAELKGVAYYLDTHKLGAGPLAAMVNGRGRATPDERAEVSTGTSARSAGELRRKTQPVQTPG